MLHNNGMRESAVLAVVFASAANALNQADRAIMPIVAIPMAEQFQWSMFEKGIVLSSFALGYLLVQIPSGMVSTQFAPFVVLAIAVLVWSICTTITPTAAEAGLYSLLACRICMGLAEGFCLPATFQLFTMQVPLEMRSRAFAMMISCGSIGQLLAIIICPQMANWSSIFVRFGITGLAWSAAVAALWAMRRQVRGPQLFDIESKACRSEALKLRKDDFAEGGNVDECNDAPVDLADPTLWKRLLACQPLLAIMAAHFGQNWTQYTLSMWLPTYLHEVMGVQEQSLSIMALPYFVNSFAGVGWGILADLAIAHHRCSRLTVRRVATAVGLLGPGVCCVAFVSVSSPSLALGVMTLSSLLGAATSSGYMANHGDITGRYAGLTFAVSNTLATLPGILVGPFTAWLVKNNGGLWKLVFLLAAALNGMCTCVYIAFSQAHRIL